MIEAVVYFYLISFSIQARKYLRRYLLKDQHVKLGMTGEDLKNLGVSQGELIGALLKETLGYKLDGRISNKKQELNFIRNKLRDPFKKE